MAVQIRLDKFLADTGIGTRSDLKIAIRKGRVKVNGEVCKKPEMKINKDTDKISFDDSFVDYQEYLYFMLHKPAGVVSATIDNASETVMDLIPSKLRKDLFPVGRLDKDTEGFLLITNDGALAHQLLSPKRHVDKVYYAKVEGNVTEEDKKQLEEGVNIGEDYTTLPAKLTILKSDEISEIELTIREGKFHQVKRMFEAIGKEVIYLKRVSMGGLSLDPDLEIGEYRSLTEDEISYLKGLTTSNSAIVQESDGE